MADNLLEVGPSNAKRAKLNSPALSVSASDSTGKSFKSVDPLAILHTLSQSKQTLVVPL